MKKAIGTLMLISVICFSCKKGSVKPDSTTGNPVQEGSTGNITNGGPGTTSSTAVVDSMNNVKGSMRLQLAKDSINTDNILINFTPNSQTSYVAGVDAPTLQGFGQVSLSSLSSNNIPLSIYTLPLTPKGLSIGLRVNAQSDGLYTLNLKSMKSIPVRYDLWLKDAYTKDSLEMRYNTTYSFNIYKADTSSFGANRFKLVMRTR